MKILLTRPLEDSIELASVINNSKHEAIINPLLKIITKTFNNNLSYDAYLITSKHALPFIRNKKQNLLVVGKHTYELALSLGYINAVNAGKNINDLKTNLNSHNKFLYLSGTNVTDDLSGFHNITREIAYEAIPILTPSPTLLEFLKLQQPRAALFFSLRTAEIFVEIINKYRLTIDSHDIITLSLSKKIESYLQKQGFTSSSSAISPDAENLISMIDTLK